MLQDEPVTVQVAGEAFRLEHINRSQDLPSHTKGIFEAVSLMKTNEDWLNLPPLVAGYYKSPNKLTSEQKERLVRKVGKAGRVDMLLLCAKRVNFTGFTLDSPHIVAEIAWYAQNKPLELKWQRQSTEKALSMLEEISYLLEDKRHSGSFKIGDQDPRVRPELIGTMLQLASVLSVKYHECKDKDGKVKKYAERLRAVIEAGEDILESGICKKFGEDHFLLYRVAPIVHGIRLAQKVLEPDSALTYWLEAQARVYGDVAENSYKKLSAEVGEDRKGLRSMDSYNKLLGSNAEL